MPYIDPDKTAEENAEDNGEQVLDSDTSNSDTEEYEGTFDESQDEPVAVEDEESPQGDESDPNSPEARKQRRDAQIQRLKDRNRELTEQLEKARSGSDASDAVLARLELRGVTDAEAQAYVLKTAKVLGTSPIAALDDEVVKDRLAAMKKAKDKRESSPAPTNRTGGGSGLKSVEWYIQRGQVPSDPDLLDKYHAEMARRAKEGK